MLFFCSSCFFPCERTQTWFNLRLCVIFSCNSYILNRGWIDKSQKKTPSYKEIVREDDLSDLEKSEEELEAAEEFESKYNFRFEDAQGDKLTGYSRTIDDSVRNADDKRKRQRKAAKERKKEEKIRQLEELKRAKNLKKQEIFNKLKQIQEITGNKSKYLRTMLFIVRVGRFRGFPFCND